MTSFDNEFAEAAWETQVEQYGERCTYFPRTGVPVDVWVIVDRSPTAELAGVPGAEAPKMIVTALNRGGDGIASGTIDTGGDELRVATRKGAVDQVSGPKRRPIRRLLKDRGGLTVFEVR